MYVTDGNIHTLSVNSPKLIFVLMLCLICADIRYVDSEHLAQRLEPKAPHLQPHCSFENNSNYSLPNVKLVVVQPAHFDTEQSSSW
jgi:hypothetical protein